MADIDHIEIRPDKFGWTLYVWPHPSVGQEPDVFGIGDAIQFHAETERTIGQWLADGPADFHASAPYDQQEDNVLAVPGYDRAAFRAWLDSFKTPRRK